ncbi:hypothetical protein S245_019220, partial [Arachis hypogaea]
ETKEVEKVVVVVIVVNKTIAHACVDEGNDDYLITGLERSHGCLRRRKKRESQLSGDRNGRKGQFEA